MSKLSQLCSYLERPDANELAFAVGSPAIVKSTTRDLPVTVTPLNARAIARFFEGTDVASLLVGGDKTRDVNFDVGTQRLTATVVKKGVKLSVTVRLRGASRPKPAASTPSPTPKRERRQPKPDEAPANKRKPRTVDIPSLGGPETGLPRRSVAPETTSTRAPQPETTSTKAPQPEPPPKEPESAPVAAQAASPAVVAAAQSSSPAADGLGYRLAPRRVRPAGTPRLDAMLRQMVELDASDLHLSAESRPMVRLHGKMQPLEGHPSFPANELAELLLEIVDDNAYADFVETADADFAYAIRGVARFRANYFADRKGMGAVFRQIPVDILTPDVIGLPPKVLDLCWLSKGLVLVTGPTGSGKSTTLASMIDFINRNRDDHIITIEDPIEFVHDNKRCLINQREVGRHTKSFKSALRAALREDPDVILVGELRDLETIHIALETAETGHLVFGTLHTTTAPSTVDRLIDQFPGDQQAQIRTMLGGSLRGVIGQTLLRRKTGGRVAAYEILLHTNAVGNLIREGKTHQLKNTMQVSKDIGMQNLNDHLVALVQDGTVEAREAYLKAVDKQNLVQMFEKAAIQFDAPEE
ncbi:MAG: PilT/PilU family type 4a pilus ATPase [Nannocystaceae bacterium]